MIGSAINIPLLGKDLIHHIGQGLDLNLPKVTIAIRHLCSQPRPTALGKVIGKVGQLTKENQTHFYTLCSLSSETEN